MQDILNHADELARRFEAYEPAAVDAREHKYSRAFIGSFLGTSGGRAPLRTRPARAVASWRYARCVDYETDEVPGRPTQDESRRSALAAIAGLIAPRDTDWLLA